MRTLLASTDLASRLGIAKSTSAATAIAEGADVPRSEVTLDG